MSDELPWCCAGTPGYVSECPLCPQYGTSLLDPCPGHPATDDNQQAITTARLHAERRHPGYEYATTRGPRKQWDTADEPPMDDNGETDPAWEANLDAGRPGTGWDRFDYHEEAYWRRPKRPDTLTSDAQSGFTVAAARLEPNAINLPFNGRPLVTINLNDGTLQFADGYEPDEAARLFWEAVQRHQPDPMTREFGAPLTATINAHLKAGEEAERKVARLDQMAQAWKERLPDTVNRATVVEAIHHVTRGDDDGDGTRRQAYDAVFAYIRRQPRDFMPATIVDRNAMIWDVVHVALGAVGIASADQVKQEG